FEVLPSLAAELGECRPAAVGADVLRDLADLLVRDVEPIVAAEAEEEVVAGDPRHSPGLEAEQLADAVVLVDDEVAGAEVGEGLEGTAGWGGSARRALAKDLRVGEQGEPQIAPHEAAPGRRDGEQELGVLG